MTRSRSRLPTVARFAVAVLALLVAVMGPAAPGAATSKQDVRRAEAKVRRLLSDVHQARAQLAGLQQDLAVKTEQVDAAAGRLDQITAQLLATQQRLQAATEQYAATVNDLNDRAVSAFIGGPAENFDLLLGSSSFSEMSDRMEFLGAVAQNDADLAETVANTRVELKVQQAELAKLQGQQQVLLTQARAQRAAVVDNLSQQQTLLHRIGSDLSRAESEKRRVSKSYRAELRAAANQGYGGSHANVPIPPGYAHVFQTCPVGQPRAFTDGFGEARYGGGYHLHKGNDIVAPEGAPIYAPFDGYATEVYDSLGGNVEEVSGRDGTVINAHLSAYAPGSTGAVHAGDLVGYVGMTGDAIGVPHDHFEFHPNVMPSSWPASPYGYSIIEDAVDPYPLLVQVCG